MANWEPIASLWKAPKDKQEKFSASGKTIGVGIFIPAHSAVILRRNKSDHEKSPTWDLVIVPPNDEKSQGGDQQQQNGNDDIPF